MSYGMDMMSQTQPDYSQSDRIPLNQDPLFMSISQPKYWCRLVSLSSEVPIREVQCTKPDEQTNASGLVTLGRQIRCTFRYENKKISSEHCKLFYVEHFTDTKNEYFIEAFIEDTSANGVWINRHTRLAKNTHRLLHNGDIISLINPGPGPLYTDEVEKLSFTVCLLLPSREDVLASRSNKQQYHLMSTNDNTNSDPNNPNYQTGVVNENGVLKSLTVNRLLRQARNIHDYYDQKCVIGQGGNGQVVKAVNRLTGQEVAVKVIDTRHCFYHVATDNAAANNENSKDSTCEQGTSLPMEEATGLNKILQEAHMLRALIHPRITKLEDIFSDGHNLYIVMELLSGGDLFDRVIAKKRYTEAEAKKLLAQLLDGINYLHSRNIAHRDLKIENIMLVSPFSDIDIKITDFGLAKSMDESGGLKTFCGTPQYFAPEVLAKSDSSNQSTYDLQSDMWSIGTIAYVLLSGRMPWATNDPKKMYKQIATAKYSFSANEWAGISDEAKSFISSLLVVDPAKRLTASGAMQHSWIVDECSKSCTSNNEKYNDSISSELEKSAMSIDVVEPYVPLKADGTTTGADTSFSNAMEDGSTIFNTSSPNNMAEVPRQVNAVGGNKKKGTVRKPAMAQINEGENEDEDSTPRDAERTTSKPTTRSSKRKKI